MRDIVSIIKPSSGFSGLNPKEIWQYKDLFYFLAWRDVKVRYKQAAMGIVWALLQPLLMMLIFSFIFGRVAPIDTGGVPYPIFVFLGLLPWLYFASVLNSASTSIVTEQNLVTKIYFPRLILPASAAISSLVEFIIGCGLLVILLLYYKVTVGITALFAPVLVFLIMIYAVGFGLWFSALNVRYRDIQYALPFFVQIWMFATPVIYPANLAGSKSWLLNLNPMTGVVEGIRACVLGGEIPWYSLLISVIVGVCVFLTGAIYFKKVERFFADIV